MPMKRIEFHSGLSLILFCGCQAGPPRALGYSLMTTPMNVSEQ